MNKSDLLNWLQKENQQWEALLAQIGPERMEQSGAAAHWSIKDLVAHLTGWNHWLVANIQAVRRGEPDPPPPWPAHLRTEDDINAWIYETHRGRSLRDILDEMQQVFQQLLAAVQGFPDNVRIETIRQGGRQYYLVRLGDQRVQPGEFFDHFHDDHEPDLRAWLVRVEKG